MYGKRTLQLMATCCLLSLIACQPPALSPSQEATEMALPMPTHTPIPTLTSIATPLPPTPTITLMPTLAPIVTRTPLPALPPDEALNRVLELYETNGGCQYPCWWGIIPGETTWADARHFLSAFASRISDEPGPNYPDILVAEVFLPQMDTMETGRHNIHVYVIKNGFVEMIEVHPTNALSPQVGDILRTYGPPDEVYLRGSLPAISFTLFYKDQSFFFQYGTNDTTVEEEMLKVCLPGDHPNSVKIIVWSLAEQRSFADVYDEPDALMYEHPLAEVTDLNIQQFHEMFSVSAGPACLKTPVEHWLNL